MSKKEKTSIREKMEDGKPDISRAALQKAKPYTDTVTGKRNSCGIDTWTLPTSRHARSSWPLKSPA